MDYELIVSALQKASAFDLYRLSTETGGCTGSFRPIVLENSATRKRPCMRVRCFVIVWNTSAFRKLSCAIFIWILLRLQAI